MFITVLMGRLVYHVYYSVDGQEQSPSQHCHWCEDVKIDIQTCVGKRGVGACASNRGRASVEPCISCVVSLSLADKPPSVEGGIQEAAEMAAAKALQR
jgi:hypothetical protein